MQNYIRPSLEKVMQEYLDARKEPLTNHPLGEFVRQTIPSNFSNLSFIDTKKYKVKASVGVGRWTHFPWIAIMNRNITTSTQRGYYIVYLFSEDMKRVYLTLAQGVTETSKEEMTVIKKEIRDLVKQNSMVMKDSNIDLGSGQRAKNYAFSTAVYIEYTYDNLPSEEELQEDLKEMIDIYEEYVAFKIKRNDNKWFVEKIVEALNNLGGTATLSDIYKYFDERYGYDLSIYKDWRARVRQQIYYHSSDADIFEGKPGDENDLFYAVEGKGKGLWGLRKKVEKKLTGNTVQEEAEVYDLSTKELVEHIHKYIQSKGFLYSKEEVTNFFLSLKTKPFVILSGISGTGKTKIVQWFAESIGATEENGRFALIPVRPDWNDGSDLLGYVDIQGKFKEGPLTKVIKRAIDQPTKPFIVLLDEMNLARVEHYFSDILSVMESRKWVDGKIVSSKLLSEEVYGSNLTLPSNLYIIGTVNMDETTHPFSKKVLDRANTIEFNQVDLSNLNYLQGLLEKEPIKISDQYLSPSYLHLKDVYLEYEDLVEDVTEELVKINAILETMYAQIGYRVRDEICFYLAYNAEGDLLSFEQALDHCILQKILPRISGSDTRVDRVLKELYRLFTNKEYNESIQNLESDLETAKYPNSARKVLEMIRRLEEDGFTSFWIS